MSRLLAAGRSNRSRLDGALLVGLLGTGAGFRIWQWGLNRSLWTDEAAVAIGLLLRPAGQQLGAHDFGQLSPPGWLALVDLSVAAFGPNELALRLPTLIAAIAYLPALWWLSTRLLPRPAALLCLAMTAFSPVLISYGAELKAYGADPLISVGILAVLIDLSQRPSLSLRRAVVTGLGLGIATWFSTAAIIIVGGGLLVLVATPAGRRATFANGRAVVGRVLLAAIPLAAFGLVYLAHYRPEPWLDQYLQRFWEFRLWTPGPDLPRRIWTSLMNVVSPLFFGRSGDLFPGLILLLLAAGIRRWLRMTSGLGLLMVGPLLAWVVLAIVGAYPMASRLGLFAAPCLTLALGSGWDGLAEWSRRRQAPIGRWLPAVVVIWLVGPVIGAAVRTNLDALSSRAHARPIVRELRATRPAADPIYLFARAVPEWWFYTTDWRDPDRSRVSLFLNEFRYPDGPTFGNAPSRRNEASKIDTGLRYRYAGMEEIYGVFSGLEQRDGIHSHGVVDAGWARLEVDRMTLGDPPCLWLVEFHSPGPERRAVLQELRSRDFRLVREIAGPTSRVERVCRAGR